MDSNLTNITNYTNRDYICEQNIRKNDNQAAITLWITMIIFVVGLLGNLMNVIVFSSKDMCKISSNNYLLFLAISDSAYLVSVLVRTLPYLRCLYFLNASFDFHHRSVAACKLLQYFLDLTSDYSSLLVLSFTAERFMACYFPIQFKDICTPLRAKCLCTILLLIIGSTIIYPNFTYIDLTVPNPNDTQSVCTIQRDVQEAHKRWYLAEMLIFRVIPIIFVAAINVCIIIKVKGLKEERNKRKRNIEHVLDKTGKTNGSGKKNKVKEETATQLTIMLTVVSTSYVITYLPDLCLFISEGILTKLYEPKKIPDVTMQRLIIADNAIRPLYILGFSINFFLYTVSGQAFRQQLKKILYRHFNRDRGHPHYERTATNGHTEI